jgi:hypothetical protein
MTTYRFEEVTYAVTRNLKCECGKRLRRSRTFAHTVNPFNVNKETGQPKTLAEVWADVKAEGDAWQPEPVCGDCKES